jgi:hypothetical protein
MNFDNAEGFRVTKTTRQAAGLGTWVMGWVGSYKFQALVFPAHADNAGWELGTSRIAKLCIRRGRTNRVVMNFDRGWDVQPQDETVQVTADVLCAGLAEHVYGGERSLDSTAVMPDDTRRPLRATEFATAREAVRHAKTRSGLRAIVLDGKHLVVSQEQSEVLETAGVAFAYLNNLGGQIVTVPVNG